MPRPRRYAVLDQIPGTLSLVMDQLDLAKGYTLGDPERTRLIIGAGRKSYGTIVDLTRAAPLWMALQRQVLVKGWRFEDLEQLDQLTIPIIADLLIALQIRPEERVERFLAEALSEDFVNGPKETLERVKKATIAAAAADGLTAPSAEILLVDQAHFEVDQVRRKLAELLASAQHDQDAEVRLEKRLGPAIAVIAFLTTAALQLPEVQQEIVQAASVLAQMVQHMLEAVTAQVGALGMVAATSVAAAPGEGFSPVGPDAGPNTPQPGAGPHGPQDWLTSAPGRQPAASESHSTLPKIEVAEPEGMIRAPSTPSVVDPGSARPAGTPVSPSTEEPHGPADPLM